MGKSGLRGASTRTRTKRREMSEVDEGFEGGEDEIEDMDEEGEAEM